MSAAASEPRARARVGARRTQEVQEVEEGGWRPVTDRAGSEGTRSFHNHGEGPYKGLLLVEMGYYHFTLKNILRHYAEQKPEHGM